MNYSPDVTTATIKMILSLGFILALVWGLYRIAKKKVPMLGNGRRGQLIQVIENHCIGVKKNIALVRVPGSVLVLGIGAERVSLLSQIADPAVIKRIETATAPTESVVSFKDQLKRFTKGAIQKEALECDRSLAE